MSSSIEWTEETWNPVIGCQRVSEGCRFCYAERMAAQRLEPNPQAPDYDGIAQRTDAGPRWTGNVKTLPGKLVEPLRWKKPRRVFVNSMSDLFHPDVPMEFIAAVFGVMAAASDHTFQVLTKRPQRAGKFFRWVRSKGGSAGHLEHMGCAALDKLSASPAGPDPDYSWWWGTPARDHEDGKFGDFRDYEWPLPNVWLGVSAENQDAADQRIPYLLNHCPAAVRFVSAEPLLGPISFRSIGSSRDWRDVLNGVQFHEVAGPQGGMDSLRCRSLDWVIVGGESGPNARGCAVDDLERIVEDCREGDVPVFVKQLGANPLRKDVDWKPVKKDENNDPIVTEEPIDLDDDKGGDPDEWPGKLQVQQYPQEATDE